MNPPAFAVRRLLARAAASIAVVLGLLLLAAPAATAADGDPIQVGTEGTYPPFSYSEGGELTGYDIEVMKAVADKAGWDINFVQSSWDALFAALDAKRVDTIANQVTINPDREAAYVFSEPYTYSRGVIVTRADEDSITKLSDLKGKVAAESPTSNWAEVARKAGAKIESIEQFSQAVELLVQGRVDVIVNDNIAVLDYLNSTDSNKIKIAGNAGDEISEQALVFRKEDAAKAKEATAALTSLRADGTLGELSKKYFGADVSVPDGGDVDVADRGGRSSWQVVKDEAWPMLRALVLATIPLALGSFALGLVLAVGVALARLSPSRWLNLPARAFVSVIRGTPLLVQLFIIFYGLPQIGLKFAPWPTAILALSLNVAGYAAEVIRAAILSVPRGQSEAASSIGMGYALTLRRIVLPQAARVAVPPLWNTFISLVKDTSLVSVVLITEMFRIAQVAAGQSTRYMALYTLAAIYYWIVCTLLAAVQNRLEKSFGRYTS